MLATKATRTTTPTITRAIAAAEYVQMGELYLLWFTLLFFSNIWQMMWTFFFFLPNIYFVQIYLKKYLFSGRKKHVKQLVSYYVFLFSCSRRMEVKGVQKKEKNKQQVVSSFKYAVQVTVTTSRSWWWPIGTWGLQIHTRQGRSWNTIPATWSWTLSQFSSYTLLYDMSLGQSTINMCEVCVIRQACRHINPSN